MKQKTIKKVLILVAILAVPGFLYYLLQDKGKNRYKPLPIYGSKQVASTFHSVRGKKIPDTIYHVIDDFKLLNQNADTISLANYKGKVLLVNLFYTEPKTKGVELANKAMDAFSKLYEKNKMVHCVGISINPIFDTPTVLASYAQKFNASATKWDLLTGDVSTVNHLVKNGLLLDALKTESKDGPKFVYSNMFVLLDTKYRIRGFYEATNQEALSKLDDEIKVLIAEELRNMRDGR